MDLKNKKSRIARDFLLKYKKILYVIPLLIICIFTLSLASADSTGYYLTPASVLFGRNSTENADVTVSFTSRSAGTSHLVNAYYSTKETNDNNSYITLKSLTPPQGITPNENDLSSGHIYYVNANDGISLNANGTIWTATYTVNKNTPAGEYTVGLNVGQIALMPVGGNYSTEVIDRDFTLTATITVTREEGPEEITPTISSISNQVFTGSAITPAVTVKATINNTETTLTQGTDYTVEYLNNINAGTATVRVNPKSGGAYTFSTVSRNFTITKYPITASNIILEYDSIKYNGASNTPTVTVKIGNYTVNSNEYTVQYNNNTGREDQETLASATVAAKQDANISGSATKNFVITPKTVLTISGISDQTVEYTGSPVELDGRPVVAENSGNITASDLTTTWYASDGTTVIDQPTEVGTYIVVFSYSDNNYYGSLSVNVTIVGESGTNSDPSNPDPTDPDPTDPDSPSDSETDPDSESSVPVPNTGSNTNNNGGLKTKDFTIILIGAILSIAILKRVIRKHNLRSFK